MDFISTSTKMVESEEFKNNQKNLLKEIKILYEQMLKVQTLMNEESKLHQKGFAQVKTYSNNGRGDMITSISANPIKSWEFHGVLQSLKRFIKIKDNEQ